MGRAIYVVGAPGAGKSTFTRALADRLGTGERVQLERPLPHVDIGNGWAEVGRDRGAFGGTDALGYTAISLAVPWVLSDQRPAHLLGEGDRLAVARFLSALEQSYELTVIHLTGNPALAWKRVEDRAAALGLAKLPNYTWWAGRVSKAANIARAFNAVEVDLALPTNAAISVAL